jgi:excinuclease ABC subunit A
LEELAALIDQLLPEAEADWTQKVLVNYSIDKKPVATLVTKRPAALDLVIAVPAGSVQLGQVANFGVDSEISHRERSGLDEFRLRFTKVEQVKNKDLHSFLTAIWTTPASQKST